MHLTGALSAWITIDERQSDEYAVVLSDDGLHATCWISSEAGKVSSPPLTTSGLHCNPELLALSSQSHGHPRNTNELHGMRRRNQRRRKSRHQARIWASREYVYRREAHLGRHDLPLHVCLYKTVR